MVYNFVQHEMCIKNFNVHKFYFIRGQIDLLFKIIRRASCLVYLNVHIYTLIYSWYFIRVTGLRLIIDKRTYQ